jgi:hypothetical protein
MSPAGFWLVRDRRVNLTRWYETSGGPSAARFSVRPVEAADHE